MTTQVPTDRQTDRIEVVVCVHVTSTYTYLLSKLLTLTCRVDPAVSKMINYKPHTRTY